MFHIIRALPLRLTRLLTLMLPVLTSITMATSAIATGLSPQTQQADGILFGGTNSYVTFGAASQLGLSTFTLETWFRRDAAGAPSYTGTGGLLAIPLVTKGRGEADGSRVDMNYFLGIGASSGVLVADFEDKPAGGNHPITGATQLQYNVWYHAAVSYDGTTLRLYLNGNLENAIKVSKAARNDSIQHAAIGSALDSTGAPDGFFAGAVDEVRIWDYARPVQQIKEGMRFQLTSATVAAASGLVAHWGFNEGSGTSVYSTVSQTSTGSIRGSNWSWSRGKAFESNRAPSTPALLSPAIGANIAGTTAELRVFADDMDNDNLQVAFYGRPAGRKGEKFSIAVLPDTQYYTGSLNGGTPAMFTAQTKWVVTNLKAKNVAYLAHLGDVVENGNASTTEWSRATQSLKLLEDRTTTGLLDGLPFGLAVGNHDQSPDGDPTGTSTRLYNQYFGTTHFRTRNYYGGRFDIYQDNHYQFFSAAGMDFMVIYLEFSLAPDAKVLSWADQLMKSHPDRRTIIVNHSLLGYDGEFSASGRVIFDALKGNANLFLMLCGHNSTEQRRQDVAGSQTITTILADYQFRTNGGNGWMRLLEFDPSTNQISVSTLSPYLNQTEGDADSRFSVSYDMQESGYSLLRSSINSPSATTTSYYWSNLTPNTDYEWYATVSDGVNTVKSQGGRFKTGN